MSKKFHLVLICCLFALSGCNLIYKQNVQQGNAIEQDKLDQLKLGMTMNQVAFLLGTPAVRDPFHQNRWDYYHSYAIRGGEPATRLVTLRFENAILNEITGADFDNQDAVIKAEPERVPKTVPAPEEIIIEPEIVAVETADSSVTLDQQPQAVEQPALNEAVVDQTDVDPPVREEVAEPVTEDVTEADVSENEEQWVIQVGVFASQENAENLLQRMKDEGFEGSVTHRSVAILGDRYLVRTVGYESKTQAQRQLEMLNSALQLDAFLIPPGD
jgi:outer membrane protein assembly factor BamE